VSGVIRWFLGNRVAPNLCRRADTAERRTALWEWCERRTDHAAEAVLTSSNASL